MSATPCIDCPLRALPLFVPHSEEELALVQFLKRRELTLEAEQTLIHEGQGGHPAVHAAGRLGLSIQDPVGRAPADPELPACR